MNTTRPADTLRRILASLNPSASHTVIGQDRPQVAEIFAPESHAGALDPNVSIVLGARGSGKSFWAGVLGSQETRLAAASVFPRLGLEKMEVQFGFIGQEGEGSVSRDTIDSQMPEGLEQQKAKLLWRAVVLRSVLRSIGLERKLKQIMDEYLDPEEWEEECHKRDNELFQKNRSVLVVFDALDSLAEQQDRLQRMLDALLQVAWSMRSYRAIRVKLFLRDDQILWIKSRFAELPKLIAGATRLTWRGTDLYGMLYERLSSQEEGRKALNELLQEANLPVLKTTSPGPRKGWLLSYDRTAQAKLFTLLAGPFMGKNHKRGKTYDWPLNHLSDGHNEVTPRSFLALMINAAKSNSPPEPMVLSAEGIRHGLREASKIRVEQLALEFPWIRRVLAPLARLQVPCESWQILERWEETQTYIAVIRLDKQKSFMLPFSSSDDEERGEELLIRLKEIGVLTERSDGRYDMPDLFRVAARLLKKGGVAPYLRS